MSLGILFSPYLALQIDQSQTVKHQNYEKNNQGIRTNQRIQCGETTHEVLPVR